MSCAFFSPGLAQSADLGPYSIFLQQKNASLRPAVQPFALGELSALRMRGTSSNRLGFLQVSRERSVRNINVRSVYSDSTELLRTPVSNSGTKLGNCT